MYTEWFSFWNRHFEEMASSFKLFSDELLRSTYVTVLHRKDLPIAMHFYSVWNLESEVHQGTKYLKQYPHEAIDKIKSLQISKALSMEYFYVNPDWRFQKSGLPLSEVLVGLGMNICQENPYLNGVITIARRAVKAQDRGGSWGLDPVYDLELHNNPCSVIVCHKNGIRENKNPQAVSLTEFFWKKRKMFGFPNLHELFADDQMQEKVA